MTFSIVACDLPAEQWGVAVASKFLAVGSVVPWAEAGTGAIATQALANTSYGPQGLSLLLDGSSARESLDRLVAADLGRDQRQAGVVDARGRSATHTGAECMAWAGGRAGRGYAAQGNILAGPDVVDSMATSFESSSGALSRRLLAALRQGDQAGGDRRGRQSAALLVVAPNGGYGGYTDRLIDLRVDDHADPVSELERLLGLHELLSERAEEDDKLVIEGALADELRELLDRAGYPPGVGPDAIFAALREWVGVENLEGRWWNDPRLDPAVLERLRAAANR